MEGSVLLGHDAASCIRTESSTTPMWKPQIKLWDSSIIRLPQHYKLCIAK